MFSRLFRKYTLSLNIKSASHSYLQYDLLRNAHFSIDDILNGLFALHSIYSSSPNGLILNLMSTYKWIIVNNFIYKLIYPNI